MRRIVYFSFPAHGHVNPTLPVMRELSGRGQQVIYYGTDQFRQAIRDTGALYSPYSSAIQMPERGAGPFGRLSSTLETLLDFTCAILDTHLEQVRLLRPTHVMYDSFAPWGPLMAQLLRLPSIASVPSILINGEIDGRYGPKPGAQRADPGLSPEWYGSFRQRLMARLLRFNLRTVPTPPELLQSYGDVNLVYTSRYFQPLEGAFDRQRFRFVGPCFQFRPHARSFPLERLDDRPLVLISLGTVYGDHPQFLRACMEELADGPWQVVLAAGAVPVADLEPAPSNFLVCEFVPQIEILRRCAGFVSHGGMNSVQEALYHGVPLVLAPQAADQFWISARVAELGAALVLDGVRLFSGEIRASVAEILASSRFAAAAARIGTTLHEGGHRKAADEVMGFLRGAPTTWGDRRGQESKMRGWTS